MITKDEIKTLKKQVEYILETEKETRNSDKLLTIRLWNEFYSDFLARICGYVGTRETYVKLNDILELPTTTSISRLRRQIQNDEHKFVPTTWEIAKHRRMQEDVWRSALGYNVSPEGQLEFINEGAR